MLLLLLLFVIVAVLLIFVAYKHLTLWKKKDVPQLMTAPFIGEMWRMMIKKTTFQQMVLDLYNSFPGSRYFGTHQLGEPVLLLKDPELIKQLCVKDFDHFLDHRGFLVDADTDYLWSKSLFNLRGKKWKDMRSNLSPSFTSSKIKQMFVLMSKCAEDFTEYLSKHPEETEEVNLKECFSRYTNDVIASVAFGIKINSLEDKQNEFFLRGRNVLQLKGFWTNIKIMFMTACPNISKLIGLHFVNAKTSGFFKKVVKESVEYRQKNNVVRPDMINLMLQAGKETEEEMEDGGFAVVEEHLKPIINKKEKLDIKDITSQVFIFFLAGFESVATVMSFLAYELAVNPEIQDKLRQEIFKNKTLSYETLTKMTYLDMVVSEALRKYPPSLVTDRACTKPYTIEPKLKGEKPVHLTEVHNIWIPVFGFHMDPKYYPDPEKFDPERFSPENKKNVNPYTYFPFGVGPRNCIGSRFALMEIKVLLYHLLAHYEIVPIGKSVIPLKFAKASMTMDVEGGFWFGFKQL